MNKHFFYPIAFLLNLFLLFSCSGPLQQNDDNMTSEGPKTGSVIFIHPDGSGAGMWGAMRLLKSGPDGFTNWDEMEAMGLYRSHQTNSTNSSSHAGATVHAFGKKVPYDTYGIHPDRPITSLSGKTYSIMAEAKEAGMATALVNSGHLCEPGTGVFVANSAERYNFDTIAEQIIHSGTDIIFSGGEVMLLPEGVMGRHNKPGIRKDGRNLIEEAMQLGYTVVYNRKEMMDLPPQTEKILGVFAAEHTFNDVSEEELKEKGLPNFNKDAPSVAEMTRVALTLLEAKGKQFLLVVEEEASDNFSNSNNASGALEALQRADDAIGIAMGYIAKNPNTLLVTAADSDAGGMQVVNIRDEEKFEVPLPPTVSNGAPLDGIQGTETLPFIAKPDKEGVKLRFGICWANYSDVMGAVIAKAHGMNAEYLPNNVDNTEIYRLMYRTLFGVEL
jgi:alkaline phosphatase